MQAQNIYMQEENAVLYLTYFRNFITLGNSHAPLPSKIHLNYKGPVEILNTS